MNDAKQTFEFFAKIVRVHFFQFFKYAIFLVRQRSLMLVFEPEAMPDIVRQIQLRWRAPHLGWFFCPPRLNNQINTKQ